LPDGIFSNQKSEFGGSRNEKYWYILGTFSLFYSHLVFFLAIWYILWSFGIISHVLVCWKIWQPWSAILSVTYDLF
jgi:hypothetical protein